MIHKTSPSPDDDESPESAIPWHAQEGAEALARLDTPEEGLDTAEVERRRRLHGPNSLPEGVSRGPVRRFLAQFHNLLIYVLIAAAAITALLGHAIDTAVILMVVVLNAVIGFLQEGRAEKALDAIRQMISPQCTVLREGHRTSLPAEELVPGDLVLLEAGDRVPADLRLIRARNLAIDEALLTGESMPVDKTTDPVVPETAIGDRRGIAFSGAFVTAGQGTGLVVETGIRTELGRISQMLGDVRRLETPLIRAMNRFARQLTVAILSLSALVFALAILWHETPAEEVFLAVVALAVAAIPEGLPAVMTITLAIGVQRMAGRNAIIRKLPAVETLGSVTIICSDKTGTFTRNEMIVAAISAGGLRYSVDGEGYEPRGTISLDGHAIEPGDHPLFLELSRAALLCNDAELTQREGGWAVMGDPMEGAMVALATKAGFDATMARKQNPRDDEIPFDAEHRFMATLHHDHEGESFLCLKGAPETVAALATREKMADGTLRPLDREALSREVDALAAEGQRVLAIAGKPMPAGTTGLTFDSVNTDLILFGLVGLIDPPRAEAIEAVRACREAGIGVKMITGDHAITARAIALSLGLDLRKASLEPVPGDPKPAPETDVITGAGLEGLDEDALARVALPLGVFARTSPEHKLRIVKALQGKGHVVAMTGDGVNDAPSLKRADIGISMGQKGTEVAKEASDMVLADDNFASIVAAVREGRTVYDNLTKVIGWTLPTNGGQAFAVIGAILLGLTLPVSPVQILWVNMITAVALGLTLAFEPPAPDLMRRPPRPPEAPLFSGFLVWRITLVSALFVAGAFAMFHGALLRGLSLEAARTLVVNTIVIMQIAYLFDVRGGGISGLWRDLRGSHAVLIGLGVTLLAQAAFTFWPPMQGVFATEALSWSDGLLLLAIGGMLLVLLDLERRCRLILQRILAS